MNDADRRLAAAALLRDNGALRMPIHGRSMTPSIVEPMVLQIGPTQHPGVGDVIVFRHDDLYVAHRIVALEPGGFLTAGDAQPHVIERVARANVVGRVLAIWSDGSHDAWRVDVPVHRLRGWYFGNFRASRVAARPLREKVADLCARAQPHRRARTVQRIVDALRAAQREDPAALATALTFDAERFDASDRRHRCAAILGEAARRLHVVERLPADVAAHLRRSRLNAVLGAGRMQRALHETIAVLRAANIEFALLKGAARVYGATADAAYHPSDDIDVLVRSADLDRTVAALQARGWHHRDTAAEVLRFRREHHHAASLFPPHGDFPVEVHHALAMPGTVSTASDWDALRPLLVPLTGPAGEVRQLDPVGTALHLALHAIGLARLRDVALLARALATLTPLERAALQRTVARERRDPVRLAASLALAAHVAGIPWTTEPRVARYVHWALRREDLPIRLRTRCDAAEAYFARPDVPWTALSGLIPWWSRGLHLLAIPGRFVARCASNAVAVYFARFMPPGEGPQLS